MKTTSIIEMRGVNKRFGNFIALTDFNLQIRHGEFFSLLGPSGCGKTTALRIIAGFSEQQDGEILIDGRDMHGIAANLRPTNMVFQNYAIFPHMNVGDNVAFGLKKLKLTNTEKKKRVARALEMVELGNLGTRAVSALSGGQRQRVALARALILRPKVLLLDEPLSALDKNLRETMQFELRRLQQSLGITFVMVTHDQYEAMSMSDRIGVMFGGRLKQVAKPEILYSQPSDKDVAAFIGSMNFFPAEVTAVRDKTLHVTAAGFGTLKVPMNPNVKNRNTQILLGIRPEQLDISAEKLDNYDANISGKVTDIAFYGENVHYYVKVDAVEKPVVIAVPNYFHSVDHRRGDAVYLGLQATSVIDLGSDKIS